MKQFWLLVSLVALGCSEPGLSHCSESGFKGLDPLPEASRATESKTPVARLLGQFMTRFSADASNRASNIALLAQLLGFVSLAPGESFSFNSKVGSRTEARGFKRAKTYFLGEISEDLGGGTCQVSSTLYAAMLQVGIVASERHPHSRESNYIGPGLDAVVNYPEECLEPKPNPLVCYDLRFRNSLGFSIQIKSEAELGSEDGIFKVSVFGQGAAPEVQMKWQTWSKLFFKTRYRRMAYWRSAKVRTSQVGRDGFDGVLKLRILYSDGHEAKQEIFSRYLPVPEVLEVGMGYQVTRNYL